MYRQVSHADSGVREMSLKETLSVMFRNSLCLVLVISKWNSSDSLCDRNVLTKTLVLNGMFIVNLIAKPLVPTVGPSVS